MNELRELITKFELLRHELNLFDQKAYPLTSQEVIEKSQELDNLHNQIEAFRLSKIASCSTDN